MKKSIFLYFLIILSAMIFCLGFSKKITVDEKTAAEICNEAHIAARSGNLDILKNFVMKKYKIKSKIKIKEEGIYIPLKCFLCCGRWFICSLERREILY